MLWTVVFIVMHTFSPLAREALRVSIALFSAFDMIETISNKARAISIEILSIRQVKAARALLAWSQHDLASASGISYPTIARLEQQDGALGGRASTVAAIRVALENAGIEFIAENGGGPGVRLVRDVETEWNDHRTLVHRFRGKQRTYFVKEMCEKDGVAWDEKSCETEDYDIAADWLENGGWPGRGQDDQQ